MRYAFIEAHRDEFRIGTMCRVLRVHRSGFYAWRRRPQSARTIEDARLVELIRRSHQASGGIYGSPKVLEDLRAWGETCGKHRVARLMRQHRIRSLRSSRKPRFRSGRPATVAQNRLEQQFTVAAPDRAWVTDITYLRTLEGWLFLVVVLDLFSRKVVGWSMKPTLARELVLDALLMAVWRRRPAPGLVIHSDQGSQYGSDDWRRFCLEHGLEPSMSRRGNCYDNAVAEAFFSNLKKECVRQTVYRTRDEARAAVFGYIEMFYNPTRRHGHLGQISPEAFERVSARG